jgi:predicted nucleotidyltransferase
MNVASLIIYGSCARGDNVVTSDVDLLSLTSEGEYRMIVQNKINLALYPKSDAFEMARTGELFMLHIVREGRALIDFDADFEKLKSDFRFKTSYGAEIANATSLGWALIKLGREVKNFALVNKRIAWCIRTILIAKAAEREEAIFSTQALARFANDPSIANLIENKNSSISNQRIYKPFQEFLEKWGGAKTTPNSMNLMDFKKQFEKSGNIVGLKTIKAFQGDLEFERY